MNENELVTKLNTEVNEYRELEQAILTAREQIMDVERELLVRQGRISLLEEQVEALNLDTDMEDVIPTAEDVEGFYGKEKPSVDKD